MYKYSTSIELFKVYEVVYCRFTSISSEDDLTAHPIEISSNNLLGDNLHANAPINDDQYLNKTIKSTLEHDESFVTSREKQSPIRSYELPMNFSNFFFEISLWNITNVPQMSFDEEEGDRYCETTPMIDRFIEISHLVLAINSASNIIIYMLRGNKNINVFFSKRL